MSNNAVSDMRGCIHKERSQNQVCDNCRAPLCYDCYIDAQVGSRVTARTSVDQETRADYARFCAACYLEWREKKGERRIGKPSFLSAPFATAFIYHPGIATFFYLLLTLMFTPMVIGLIFWWASYDDLKGQYNIQQRAYKILEQHASANLRK